MSEKKRFKSKTVPPWGEKTHTSNTQCHPLITSQTAISTLTFTFFVGPLSRVRPRNGILALVLVVVLVVLVVLVPLRSEFIGEL